MQVKGRHWFLLWLALFLLVATAVIARQSAALRLSREVGRLQTERALLDARRSELERRIHAASSRQVLGERAQRALGLHQATDSEFTFLVWPPPAAAPAR
jgi:cell division protein FtsB